MNSGNYKSLHYVLIILMMFAPISAVFATGLSSHCNMADNMSMSSQLMGNDVQSLNSHQYNNHSEQMNQSCCDDSCNSNCDMSTAASLLMQISSYSPVFIKAEDVFVSSHDLPLRALTPLSRPPLTIS